MSIYESTRTLESFFNEKEFQRYQKYREDSQARMIYEWLQLRMDMLMASVINHQRPALQGVLRELELFMADEFGWNAESRSDTADEADRKGIEFFVTMIGAMVKHLLLEYKLKRDRKGVALRHDDAMGLIRTAAEYAYDPQLAGTDPFRVSAAARPKKDSKARTTDHKDTKASKGRL